MVLAQWSLSHFQIRQHSSVSSLAGQLEPHLHLVYFTISWDTVWLFLTFSSSTSKMFEQTWCGGKWTCVSALCCVLLLLAREIRGGEECYLTIVNRNYRLSLGRNPAVMNLAVGLSCKGTNTTEIKIRKRFLLHPKLNWLSWLGLGGFSLITKNVSDVGWKLWSYTLFLFSNCPQSTFKRNLFITLWLIARKAFLNRWLPQYHLHFGIVTPDEPNCLNISPSNDVFQSDVLLQTHDK